MKLLAAIASILLAATSLLPPVRAADIAVTWDASPDALQYNLYQLDLQNAPRTLIASTTNLTLTVSNPSGAAMKLIVTAVNASGESGPSNILILPAIPNPPTNLRTVRPPAPAKPPLPQ